MPKFPNRNHKPICLSYQKIIHLGESYISPTSEIADISGIPHLLLTIMREFREIRHNLTRFILVQTRLELLESIGPVLAFPLYEVH